MKIIFIHHNVWWEAATTPEFTIIKASHSTLKGLKAQFDANTFFIEVQPTKKGEAVGTVV